jgi:hypothetical protein
MVVLHVQSHKCMPILQLTTSGTEACRGCLAWMHVRSRLALASWHCKRRGVVASSVKLHIKELQLILRFQKQVPHTSLPTHRGIIRKCEEQAAFTHSLFLNAFRTWPICPEPEHYLCSTRIVVLSLKFKPCHLKIARQPTSRSMPTSARHHHHHLLRGFEYAHPRLMAALPLRRLCRFEEREREGQSRDPWAQ